MTEVSLQTTVRASDDVVVRELDGEAVLLNLESGMYFGLDPVGTRVWQLIDQHHRLSAVVKSMCEEFDAPPETIERDVLRLVSELVEKRIVVAGP
jgi:coenzyme PQQ synthesis protein D (PqqD)